MIPEYFLYLQHNNVMPKGNGFYELGIQPSLNTFFLRNGGYDRLAFTLCTVDTDTPVSFAISLMEFFPFLGCKISPFYCLLRTI